MALSKAPPFFQLPRVGWRRLRVQVQPSATDQIQWTNYSWMDSGNAGDLGSIRHTASNCRKFELNMLNISWIISFWTHAVAGPNQGRRSLHRHFQDLLVQHGAAPFCKSVFSAAPHDGDPGLRDVAFLGWRCGWRNPKTCKTLRNSVEFSPTATGKTY